MKRTQWSVLLSGSFLLLAGVALTWAMAWLGQPFRGYPGPERILVIDRGSSVARISLLLEKEGIVRSARLFRWYLWLFPSPETLKAGEYRFAGPLRPSQVVEKLRRGLIYYHRLTIPEGLTMDEVADRLEEGGFGRRQRFLEAMRERTLTSRLRVGAGSVEGYLFPDTYFLTRQMSERQIVATMVDRFLSAWPARWDKRAREIQMSRAQVVTLASLIEKEAGAEEERPLVSAVFHNRLRRGIKLGCDPTVIYALRRAGKFRGVIHRSDLNFDSPYNTYLYPGLPPGPIANPGRSAIRAALYPAAVDYLYFVSRNDGTHVFSTRYRDHRRAVQRYQR